MHQMRLKAQYPIIGKDESAHNGRYSDFMVKYKLFVEVDQ